MKTRTSSKLTPEKRKGLILNLCLSLTVLNSPKEVADALTDLLTPKEIETIGKRLMIAESLIKGDDYSTIRSELKVGFSTIARVNTWLNLSGDGFKIMIERKKKSPRVLSEEEIYDPYSWRNIKRRYSMHFWPWLIFEELVRDSDRKERKKIEEIFEKLEIKGERFSREENKRLYQMFSSSLGRKKE